MKKIFAPVLALCMGFGFTSCDTDSLVQWLSLGLQVSQGLFGGQGQGDDAYIFQGTANMSLYAYNEKANTYDPESEVKKNISTTATVTVYAQEETPCVTITFDDMSIGNSNVKNFSFTTYYDYNTGTIDAQGPSYLTGGTCTLNGVQKEIPASALKGKIEQTSTGFTIRLTDIYFQIGDKLFKGTYSGTYTEVAK